MITKTRQVDFVKFDHELRLVTGIVYAPGEIDSQDDYTTEDVIRDAAHNFLVDRRIVKLMHEQSADADIVESYIAPQDMNDGALRIKKGAWVAVLHINNDGLWKSIKDGELTGLSLGGRAKRV